MTAIIPAILPSSREDLEQKLGMLSGLVDAVQVDSVDGKFATPATWPYLKKDQPDNYSQDDPMPYLGEIHYEIDLMTSDPERLAGEWISAGAERLVFHVESSHNLQKIITDLGARYGHAKDFAPGLLSLGIAFNIETDLALMAPFMEIVDYVQFMGIATIGKQGQPFDPRVLRKIMQCRQKYPEVLIQVDGGVKLENARDLLTAGVNRLVVGSALWKGASIKEELQKFTELVHEFGI
jgi:ribulose-phosphate 3-epimerase